MNTHNIPLEDLEIRQAYPCCMCMCECLCSMSLSRDGVYSSVICDCGIRWPYLIAFGVHCTLHLNVWLDQLMLIFALIIKGQKCSVSFFSV